MMFRDRSAGTILVKKDASRTRRRFTIGHELGHFLLPWHTPHNGQGFLCSSKDMAVFRAKPGGDRYLEMEVQANRFSAGVLMPAAAMRADLRKRRAFKLSSIVELAGQYDVSREAMARRCAELHDDPIAIVFSRAGVVVRVYRGQDFPRVGLTVGHPLPPDSLAARASLAPRECSSWDEGPADRWTGKAAGTVCEQSIGQQNDFRMTLLTFEFEGRDDEENEAVERAWAAPRFGRR